MMTHSRPTLSFTHTLLSSNRASTLKKNPINKVDSEWPIKLPFRLYGINSGVEKTACILPKTSQKWKVLIDESGLFNIVENQPPKEF